MLFAFLNSLFGVNRKHVFAAVILSAVWFAYTAFRYRRASLESLDSLDRPVPWTVFDSALMRFLAAFGVVVALFLFLAPPLRLPAEDPAILFQFSKNLAHTGAITYIPYGPHAEGATDFAWMVLIALGIRLHIDPLWTVGIINLVSLISLPLLLARIANVRLTPLFALVVIGGYGLMPQAAASIVGFSVLPFACILVLVVLCFQRRDYVAFCLSCLLLCLFRPDGVVFALPIQIAALIVYPERRRIAAAIAGCFAAPGLAYFLWRWHYFHSLLPLPFLVKSDAQRVARLFVVDSVETGLLLCAFAFVLAWIALRGHGKLSASTRAVLLCVLLLPNLFYFAMRLDQNAGHRFFMYLPIGAAVLTAMEWQRIRANRAVILRSWVALWIVFVCGIWLNDGEGAKDDQPDNRAAIAKDFGSLPHGTLISTEAGILPYYSGWTTYDAWGLNTPPVCAPSLPARGRRPYPSRRHARLRRREPRMHPGPELANSVYHADLAAPHPEHGLRRRSGLRALVCSVRQRQAAAVRRNEGLAGTSGVLVLAAFQPLAPGHGRGSFPSWRLACTALLCHIAGRTRGRSKAWGDSQSSS